MTPLLLRNPALYIGLAWLLLGSTLAPAETTITTPFDGVRHIHRTGAVPRDLNIHIVEIDLSHPGLDFRVTPARAITKATFRTPATS